MQFPIELTSEAGSADTPRQQAVKDVRNQLVHWDLGIRAAAPSAAPSAHEELSS